MPLSYVSDCASRSGSAIPEINHSELQNGAIKKHLRTGLSPILTELMLRPQRKLDGAVSVSTIGLFGFRCCFH